MNNVSTNSPTQSANILMDYVWYAGNDDIQKGIGLCRDVTNGTLTEYNGRRVGYATRPNLTNSDAFVGVTLRGYPGKRGGQFVEIAVPGSRGVGVRVLQNVTANDGILNATVSDTAGGGFVKGGFRGRGAAVPRQTTTAVIQDGMTGASTWSVAKDGVTVTISSNTGIELGDEVVILSGATDASGGVVPGWYKVAGLDSTNKIILNRSCVTAAPTAALAATGAVHTKLIQADLLDGDESGLVQYITLKNAGGAFVATVGGVTRFLGGVTASADGTCTLADGKIIGQLKGFEGLGTITTSDAVITVTHGKQIKDSSGTPVALASISIDAAGETAYVAWYGLWQELTTSSATIA